MNAFDYFFENSATINKPFLVGKEELSFVDLYENSIALAEYIKETVGIDNNILLISPNNAFFVTVYLAILKSGNTCVPLDPMIELEKFKYIRKITNSAMIFLSLPVQRRLSIEDQDCITSIDELPTNKTNTLEKSIPEFNSENCAEIIFTSGSTGAPKGVMLSHKNLIANTKSIVEYLNLNENDRMMVVLPFYYCYGLSLLHTHLRVGGSVVFNNSFIFIGSVLNDLKNYKCTGFAGVPSHFQILLRKSDTFKKEEFPDLKYVTQAGGKLATVFIDEFKQSKPKIKFIVMYGQTEATARLSYLPEELYEQRKGSIGKGIPGVKLRVVDSNGKDIQPDEIGEIIAQGDNIMKGYYNEREDTEATIKEGWLHTGDLGTVDNEGFIYLTARKKEIIKVGGKRISPKEIEAVILEIPEVVDCSIESVEDELLGEALKANIVASSNTSNSLNENMIKEHCSKKLELYKIPQVIEIKDKITMSATGKKIKNSN